jgi:AraC-like DNA-binding protein
MAMLDSSCASMHLSSRELEGSDRDAAIRELFGRGYLNVDVDFVGDQQFLEATAWQFPGLVVTTGTIAHSRVSTFDPPSQPDTFIFGGGLGKAVIRCRGRELLSDRGGALMFRATDAMDSENQHGWSPRMIRIDASLIEGLLPDVDDRLMRLIPADNEALRLLDQYLPLVCTPAIMGSPHLASAAALHVADLIVLALGADGDAARETAARGYAAARAAEVRSFVARRIADPGLSLNSVARAYRVSPRTIQNLFHRQHTTFSDFVLSARLAHTHRLLCDPTNDVHSISTLAYGSGFNDLSYFNRRFRKRFGRTPSDVRATARLRSS